MVKFNLDLNGKTILVTGAAGFIGSNLAKRLINDYKDIKVIGLDTMTDYYDVNIKKERLRGIEALGGNWSFVEESIANKEVIDKIFTKNRISVVVNLAAQAGVRYSITNPDAYIQSNLIGFYNILEACRHHEVDHLVYASSSSVYGSNKKVPYSTEDKVDNPVSLYAATKKSNELMAHAYSKLYNIPSTGLRFFTVYGPAGRPDMAYFGFTNKLREGKTIQIFNYGNCKRDFTYVDDIVEGVLRVVDESADRAVHLAARAQGDRFRIGIGVVDDEVRRVPAFGQAPGEQYLLVARRGGEIGDLVAGRSGFGDILTPACGEARGDERYQQKVDYLFHACSDLSGWLIETGILPENRRVVHDFDLVLRDREDQVVRIE